MHGLRETQCTGLARKIIGTSPSISLLLPCTHYTHALSAKSGSSSTLPTLGYTLHPYFPVRHGMCNGLLLAGLSVSRGKSRKRRPRWYGMVWYGMVWYGVAGLDNISGPMPPAVNIKLTACLRTSSSETSSLPECGFLAFTKYSAGT